MLYLNNRIQKGQAMVFGLIFLAACVMVLLVLFNQGQLVKNRIQVENAADAVVFSHAKLAARNLNFAAYTNRAMVANEVSIGQMVALLSWANHYKNVPGFINTFPLYQTPIVPPVPVTYAQVLSAITTPYRIMGTAVATVANKAVDIWPQAISYFNGTLGVFQKVFALATMEAQIEANLNIAEDHEFKPDERELYTPVIGWFFFVQNNLLTYFGDNFDTSKMVSALASAETQADDDALLNQFLGQVQPPGTMINDNSANISRKTAKNVNAGRNSLVNSSEDDDSAVASYEMFAAIVNRNREDFTRDRHWRVGPEISFSTPRITIPFPPLPIALITFQVDLRFFAGYKNDGGTAYIAKGSMDNNKDIASLGWSSFDVGSFGFDFALNFFIRVRLCIPIFGCTTLITIDEGLEFGLGFPIAGATHQLVTDQRHAKRSIVEWSNSVYGSDSRYRMYGGNENDSFNDGAFDPFHAVTLLQGNLVPPAGIYGLNPQDVSANYGGPPAFFSLGDNFRDRKTSYEYTVALAKKLEDIETTDSDRFNIATGDASDWDSGDIAYTRIDLQTRSRAEGHDFAGDYQQVIWQNDRPMMTISSAETYFRNPMQLNADGSEEPASLFSPFWDARLIEPSQINVLIATGEIDWQQLYQGVSGEAKELISWTLNAIGDRLVDTAVDNLTAAVPSPLDRVVEPPVRRAADKVVGAGVNEVTQQLDAFIP